jgi:hypothetical protein
MMSEKWTTSFLYSLRQEGDPEADAALQMILNDDEAKGIRSLFSVMDSNDEIPPANHFPVLSKFFASSNALPSDVDFDRIHRGEDVFEKHAFSGALALLTKSLPEGYQAPNLSIILNISGDLRTHTYRRLLGTLQTVVNVSTCRGFQAGGRAVITAQKLRLLHAGIRSLTPRTRPEYTSTYDVPVNQEDMLATIIGFSLLVILGWRTLQAGLTRDEEEDYLYMWLVFARMMGIHPPDQPDSTAYLPDSVADAMEFYRIYRARHYVDGSRNPDGVALAAANEAALKKLVPRWLRLLGFGFLPRIAMMDLMGSESCARLRIRGVTGHTLLRIFLLNLRRLLNVFEKAPHPDHERLGMIFFKNLIKQAYDGRVTYTVPTDIAQMKEMVERNGSPS